MIQVDSIDAIDPLSFERVYTVVNELPRKQVLIEAEEFFVALKARLRQVSHIALFRLPAGSTPHFVGDIHGDLRSCVGFFRVAGSNAVICCGDYIDKKTGVDNEKLLGAITKKRTRKKLKQKGGFFDLATVLYLAVKMAEGKAWLVKGNHDDKPTIRADWMDFDGGGAVVEFLRELPYGLVAEIPTDGASSSSSSSKSYALRILATHAGIPDEEFMLKVCTRGKKNMFSQQTLERILWTDPTTKLNDPSASSRDQRAPPATPGKGKLQHIPGRSSTTKYCCKETNDKKVRGEDLALFRIYGRKGVTFNLQSLPRVSSRGLLVTRTAPGSTIQYLSSEQQFNLIRTFKNSQPIFTARIWHQDANKTVLSPFFMKIENHTLEPCEFWIPMLNLDNNRREGHFPKVLYGRNFKDVGVNSRHTAEVFLNTQGKVKDQSFSMQACVVDNLTAEYSLTLTFDDVPVDFLAQHGYLNLVMGTESEESIEKIAKDHTDVLFNYNLPQDAVKMRKLLGYPVRYPDGKKLVQVDDRTFSIGFIQKFSTVDQKVNAVTLLFGDLALVDKANGQKQPVWTEFGTRTYPLTECKEMMCDLGSVTPVSGMRDKS